MLTCLVDVVALVLLGTGGYRRKDEYFLFSLEGVGGGVYEIYR